MQRQIIIKRSPIIVSILKQERSLIVYYQSDHWLCLVLIRGDRG
ncbi:hypothetical protein [Pseudanabaena mucicola]|nr:hypothetical protein [Pseudanabaena mucicola]